MTADTVKHTPVHAALRLVVQYDDLLRTFTGPIESITATENAKIDAAYDLMVEAARSAIDHPSEPTESQIEAAIEAYREGQYLTDEQVFASVSAIVRAVLSQEREYSVEAVCDPEAWLLHDPAPFRPQRVDARWMSIDQISEQIAILEAELHARAEGRS